MRQANHIKKRKITDLKEHPRQRELVGNVPEHKLAAMAADMKKHGLEHPVEILPDGTVVAGHQRVLAAKLLGWTEIAVIIRRDLDEQGPAAVVAYLIRDNLHRRQMTGLAVAHSIKALMQIQEGRLVRIERMKAEIGKQLDLDIRSVNRYLAILDSPHAVQQAFDRGDISQVNAARLGSLCSYHGAITKKQQDEISDRIAAGEPAKTVVKDYLPVSNGRHKKSGDAFSAFIKSLERALPDLEDRPDEIYPAMIKQHTPVLERSRTLITRLIAKGKKKVGPDKDLLNKIAVLCALQNRD